MAQRFVSMPGSYSIPRLLPSPVACEPSWRAKYISCMAKPYSSTAGESMQSPRIQIYIPSSNSKLCYGPDIVTVDLLRDYTD